MNNYFKQLVQQLLPANNNSTLAEQEAWWLLEAVTHTSKHKLLSNPPLLTQQQKDHLAALIAQRVQEHKPLQYIIGSVPFCNLTIKVHPPILIPRPETEEWVTWLTNLYQKTGISSFTALDLCTGTGCIGLALAKHFPQATIIGTDINPAALILANHNKQLNALTNISFVTSDLFTALPPNSTYHVIVCNPPYITPTEYQQLDADVQAWEDRNALVGGSDGMVFYQRILNQAPTLLQPLSSTANHLPNVIMEIGPAQCNHLEALLATLSINAYTLHTDLQGKKRWLSLTIPTNKHRLHHQ